MINANNPIPLHAQIKELLRKEIHAKHYDEKIPSERELMDRFSVSRTTIREAIAHLVNEGLLKKIHGKGTYISTTNSAVQDSLNSLHSLTETIKSMGMNPGSTLLYCGMATEPRAASDFLQEPSFYSIARLRTANSLPIAVERHYYSPDIGNRLEAFDLENAVIYDLIENELGVDIYEAEQIISCKEISEYDSLQLQIPSGTNIIFVERMIRNSFGETVEYYTSSFKPELYSFRIQTKRKKQWIIK